MLAAPDGSLFEGVLYVRGRYPVGSGDAFLAGLVTALEAGSWEDALRLALGAGAANAELPGAARIDPTRAGARGTGGRPPPLDGGDRTARRVRLGRLPGRPAAVPPRHAGRLRIDVRGGVRRHGSVVAGLGRGAVARRDGGRSPVAARTAHSSAPRRAPSGIRRTAWRTSTRCGSRPTPAPRASGALLDAVEGWARDRGAARLVLAVTENNEGARRFYEACFADTGERHPLREGSSSAR